MDDESKIAEPPDGEIVAWYRGRHPCAVHVRIDEFAEEEEPMNRWYFVDEERGFEEAPETWQQLCKRMGTDDGPHRLVVADRL